MAPTSHTESNGVFTDFSQLANEQGLTPKELPTAMTEEPSQSIAPPVPLTGAKPAQGAAAKPAQADAAAAKPAEKLTAAEVAAREKARAEAKRGAEKAAAPPPKKHHFGFL